jgi:hypothetical protein
VKIRFRDMDGHFARQRPEKKDHKTKRKARV